jgi:hypothetical protein
VFAFALTGAAAAEFLLASPLRNADLGLKRAPDQLRDLEL